MALPRIVYAGINLDFPENVSELKYPRVRRAGMNTADGGVSETVRSGIWDEVEIIVERFGTSAFYEAFQAFWSHASNGDQFSFALDSARTVNTTLVNAESAGATVIELALTTGIIVNGLYIMESADLQKREVVQVASISAGVSVTLAAGTKFAYSAADTFRDWKFWPKLVTTDDASPFIEGPGLSFVLDLHAREDRG